MRHLPGCSLLLLLCWRRLPTRRCTPLPCLCSRCRPSAAGAPALLLLLWRQRCRGCLLFRLLCCSHLLHHTCQHRGRLGQQPFTVCASGKGGTDTASSLRHRSLHGGHTKPNRAPHRSPAVASLKAPLSRQAPHCPPGARCSPAWKLCAACGCAMNSSVVASRSMSPTLQQGSEQEESISHQPAP